MCSLTSRDVLGLQMEAIPWWMILKFDTPTCLGSSAPDDTRRETVVDLHLVVVLL